MSQTQATLLELGQQAITRAFTKFSVGRQISEAALLADTHHYEPLGKWVHEGNHLTYFLFHVAGD